MNQVFKTIVIDDEPAARRLMKSLLQEYADVINVVEQLVQIGGVVQILKDLGEHRVLHFFRNGTVAQDLGRLWF